MKTNPFAFQQMMMRKDPVAWLSTSLDTDKADDVMEVKCIENESLINVKSRRESTFPSTRGCVMKNTDVTVDVNLRKFIEEIQRELRTALRIQVKVAQPIYCEAPD